MPIFTCVRCEPLKSLGNGSGGLGAAEAHGKRRDERSRSRVVRAAPPIAWSIAGDGRGLDLLDAHRYQLRRARAVVRKGAAVAMHLMAIVSSEWLCEEGDSPHSRQNWRVRALVVHARDWAESWCGPGSCFAVRYDCDEEGAGVVDLFVAPVQMQRRRNGATVPTISIANAKKRLRSCFHDATEYAALQSSWAAYAKAHLDRRFERGAYKLITKREHVRADMFAALAESARRSALSAIYADLGPSIRLIYQAAGALPGDGGGEQIQDLLTEAVRLLSEQRLPTSDAIDSPEIGLAAAVTSP